MAGPIEIAARAKSEADEALKQAVADAVEEGMEVTEAAARAGVTRQTVYRWIKEKR